MDRVTLGRTGLSGSRLCLGMMSFGSSKWRPWILDEAESRPIIEAAIDRGINFFDTADIYSNGLSEEILGRAIRDFGRRGRSRHRDQGVLHAGRPAD